MSNYPEIKKEGFTHERLASMFGYKNVNAFRYTSKHKIIMNAIDTIIREVKENLKKKI